VTGTLATTNGGTGLTSFTSGGVVYASSTSALATSANLKWNGTYFGVGSGTTGQGTVEIQTGSTTAGLWVQTGGTTSGYTIADFRTGTNASALALYGNTTAVFGGSVGIGTSSPGSALEVQVNNGTAYDPSNVLSVGTWARIVNTNTTSGVASSLLFQATGSGGGNGLSAITSVNTGTSSNAMTFTNRNAGTMAEMMRLDSTGNLLVGATANGQPDANYFMARNASGFQANIGHATGTASGQPFVYMVYGGSAIGSITQSGTTAVLYNVTSDQRLKENIVDAPEFGSVIDSLQVRSFDWKTDHTHQRAGFIAQELVTVAPEAVHQPTDTEEMMAVDYSKLVPMLVKEIQSLRKRISTLENK
jgi:hypothetical protein